MTRENPPKKLFTLEEANRALPLVRAIVGDMVRLAREMSDRQLRLAALRPGRKDARQDCYADELREMERDLQSDRKQLQEYLDELSELGVEAKNPAEGLVDFPCLMDERVVYLCWKLGEPRVAHWHELKAGFAGRQPLLERVTAATPESDADA